MTAPTRELAEASRISPGAAAAMRGAIHMSGGREVCFVAAVDDDGVITSARAVARGDARSVLALPGCAQRGEMLVHNHPSGELAPSPEDLNVAHLLGLDGIGFGIIDNAAAELYVVVEIPRDRPTAELDADAVSAELTSSGRVGRMLHDYEERESQRAFTRTIARLYNRGGVGLLEAGTGVGKSLAYLLPALRWSALNGERTVISTNTINLQEQIVGNDLPLLARALDDQNVRFTLLKGWRNYVCLQRLSNARAESSTLLDPEHAPELDRLSEWASATQDGSLSDLAVQPRPEVWDEISAESDLCTRHNCLHFERCFLFRARRMAAKADVIVVNHHLLMADLMVRRAQQNWSEAAVLPAYSRLVVDEGHHLEKTAGKHLGASVSRVGMLRLLSRLDRRGRGILNTLLAHFAASRGAVSAASGDLVQSRLIPAADAARRYCGDVFSLLNECLQEAGTNTLRITGQFARHEIWRRGLESALAELLREVALLEEGLDRVRERMEAADPDDSAVALIAETGAIARRLAASAGALDGALRPPPGADDSVRWIECRARAGNVTATTVPLDLSQVLRHDLFERVKTAIVTSATLTTDGSFEFVERRLGLAEESLQPASRVFPSPFHYGEQALLAIPTDVPSPSHDPEGHIKGVVTVVSELAEKSDGGMFVLCTSHRDVRMIGSALRATSFPSRWPLLLHGEQDPRDVLLSRFRASGRAVLLGTSSFWEGVDVRGEALRALVITKLPFNVPTEPLTAANCDSIAAAGGDPFTDYLLPHAALRLKQGFGRLIRSSTDWGAVVLADARIVLKQYGESLLESLPPAKRLVGPWDELSPQISRFYSQRRKS